MKKAELEDKVSELEEKIKSLEEQVNSKAETITELEKTIKDNRDYVEENILSSYDDLLLLYKIVRHKSPNKKLAELCVAIESGQVVRIDKAVEKLEIPKKSLNVMKNSIDRKHSDILSGYDNLF